MDQKVYATFQSREEAEDAARRLVERGVPQTNIAVEAKHGSSEANGPSIGSGVLPEAAEALVEAHEGDGVGEVFELCVDTHGDPIQEAVSREVFGYLA